ncbi:hypothetical protein PMES_01959, partial [Profundibacterium mesophilum KAUST100406-0324]
MLLVWHRPARISDTDWRGYGIDNQTLLDADEIRAHVGSGIYAG